MGGLIPSLIPLAIGVALSSSAIIAVILMLLSNRPLAKSIGFNLGWALAIVVVAAIWLAPLIRRTSTLSSGVSTTASTATDAVLVAIGVMFLLLGVWRWRKGVARGPAVKMPRWMRAMDRMKPILSPLAGAGVLLTNLKNLALIVAAASAILGAGVGLANAIAALLVFVIVASVLVAAPVVVYVAIPQRSASILDSWKTWLVRHNWVMTVGLFGGLGIFLVILGIQGLTD